MYLGPGLGCCRRLGGRVREVEVCSELETEVVEVFGSGTVGSEVLGSRDELVLVEGVGTVRESV